MKRVVLIGLGLSFTIGYGQNKKISEVFAPVWENYIGVTTFRTGLVYQDGTLYAPSNGEQRNHPGDDADGLYIINSTTGMIKRHINVPGSWDEDCNGVAVQDGKAYFGGDNGEFYCYDIESGKELWSKEPCGFFPVDLDASDYLNCDMEGVPILTDVSGDGHVDVVFNIETRGLAALDGITGREIWEFHYYWEPGSYMNSPAAYDLNKDGVLDFIIGGKRDYDPDVAWDYQNAVYAIDGATGRPIWHYSTHSNVHASPLIMETKDGLRIVVAEAYSDVSFLMKDGKLEKFVNLNLVSGGISGLFSSPVITDKDKLIIGTSWWGERDGVWICDIEDGNFTQADDGLAELDKTARHYVQTGPVSSSAVVADVLKKYKGKETLICTERGEMLIIDAKGNLKERLNLPSGVEASPLIADVDDDKKLEIIVACLNGKIYCYNTNRKARKKVHWGSFRGEGNLGVLK